MDFGELKDSLNVLKDNTILFIKEKIETHHGGKLDFVKSNLYFNEENCRPETRVSRVFVENDDVFYDNITWEGDEDTSFLEYLPVDKLVELAGVISSTLSETPKNEEARPLSIEEKISYVQLRYNILIDKYYNPSQEKIDDVRNKLNLYIDDILKSNVSSDVLMVITDIKNQLSLLEERTCPHSY
jgi:hypothetical protein